MAEDTKATKNANAAVETVGQVPAMLQLTLNDIEVDEDFNARKIYRPELVETMLESIRTKGLMNPLQVITAPKGGYKLISGFTRYRALTMLEKENKKAGVKDPLRVPCRLVDVDNDADAHLLNLEENTLRDSLSQYEIAAKCAFIMETFGESGASVGKRIGIGKNQVNNLTRALRDLHPDILTAWQEGNPNATSDFLIRLCSKDHETQWEKWQEKLGVKTDDAEEGEESEEGESDKDATRPNRRPSKTVLEAARDAINKADGKSDDWKKGAIAFAKFALGLTATLPGVYDPKKVAKGAKKPAADDRADA